MNEEESIKQLLADSQLVAKDYNPLKEDEIIDKALRKPTKNAKYRIVHDHPGCIGCAACVAMHGPNWELREDEKSMPNKVDLTQEEYNDNLRAAENCPVNVIHIVDLTKKKKII